MKGDLLMSWENHGEISHSGDGSRPQKTQKEVKPLNVTKNEAEESWQQMLWREQKIHNEYIMEKVKTYNEHEEILAEHKQICKEVEKRYNIELDIHADSNRSSKAIKAYTEINNKFKKYLEQKHLEHIEYMMNNGKVENIEMVEVLRKDQYTSEQWIKKFFESHLANNVRVNPEEGKTLFEDQAKINELNLEPAKKGKESSHQTEAPTSRSVDLAEITQALSEIKPVEEKLSWRTKARMKPDTETGQPSVKVDLSYWAKMRDKVKKLRGKPPEMHRSERMNEQINQLEKAMKEMLGNINDFPSGELKGKVMNIILKEIRSFQELLPKSVEGYGKSEGK